MIWWSYLNHWKKRGDNTGKAGRTWEWPSLHLWYCNTWLTFEVNSFAASLNTLKWHTTALFGIALTFATLQHSPFNKQQDTYQTLLCTPLRNTVACIKSSAVHIGTRDHLSSRQHIGMFHSHTWVSLDLCLCLWHKVLCYTSAPKSCVPLSAIGTYLSSIFTRRMVRSTWDLQLGSRWDGTHRCTTYKKYTWRLLITLQSSQVHNVTSVCAHLPLHSLFWQPVPPARTSTTSPHLLIRPYHINPTTKVDCIINLVRVLDLWAKYHIIMSIRSSHHWTVIQISSSSITITLTRYYQYKSLLGTECILLAPVHTGNTMISRSDTSQTDTGYRL